MDSFGKAVDGVARSDWHLDLGEYPARSVPGHAFSQALQWFDRAGNIVVADDTTSGAGLATPHIPSGGLVDTNVSTWPATNATSFTTIADTYMEVQNAKLAWDLQLFADSGVTAQFELFVNGTQVGTTQTVPSNTFQTWAAAAVGLPAGTAIKSTAYINLQAKVTGTGSARARCWNLGGSQS